MHETLLLLFRNRSRAAADMLRELDVQLPEHDDVCIEASDLNTEVRDAEENVELAVLSAVAHAKRADAELVARIASAAIVASAGIDEKRSSCTLI